MRSPSDGRFSAWTFVAPVVLLVAVLVVVNVLQDALADEPSAARDEPARTADATGDPGTTAPARTSPGATTEARRGTSARAPRTYVVRSGDTLGAIAERFDTSTEELRELNPDLDPNAMQPGDRVRVSS